jgi:hypothetical protein
LVAVQGGMGEDAVAHRGAEGGLADVRRIYIRYICKLACAYTSTTQRKPGERRHLLTQYIIATGTGVFMTCFYIVSVLNKPSSEKKIVQ